MANTNFKNLGNLMFFDEPQIDYFYFASLLKSGRCEEYEAKRAEVNAAADTYLKVPNRFNNEDTEDIQALKDLEQALGFLQRAVEYERGNEIAYFKQKFVLLKEKFTKKELQYISEVAELEKMFSGGITKDFDYNRLIVLINILENGIKQTKAVAQYEENRIREIATQMSKINRSRRNQLNGLWRSRHSGELNPNDKNYQEFIMRANKRFNRNIEVSYGIHGNLSSKLDGSKRHRVWGAKQYLSSIPPTVDVKVANWVTEHINMIFNSKQYYDKFEALAEEYYKTGKANTSDTLEMLVKSIVNEGVSYTTEILQNTYKDLPADQFIDELAKSLETTREYEIKGYYSNFGQFGKQLKFFSEERLKDGREVADGLFDAYKELVTELKSNKNKKITKEESLLMKAMENTGHIQTYNRIISLINKLEIKQQQYLKIQRQIQSGRRNKQSIEKTLNLGASADGDGNVEILVKITADGISLDTSAINKTSLIGKLGNGRSKAKSIEGLITGLKTKASHSLRDDISMAISTTAMKINKEGAEQKVRFAFQKALTGLKLSVGGPTYAEVAPAIQNALQKDVLLTHFPGHLNRRNDLITITLQYNNITIKSTLQDLMNMQAEQMISKLDPQLEKIQKQYISDFEDNFYKQMGKLKNTDKDFNSLAKNEEIWFDYQKQQAQRLEEINNLENESSKLWAEYQEEARKQGISEEQINNDRQKVLNSLRDSFFISDTMKTYNQYQNNLGFGGASLGADVGQQLDNLSFLFGKAGIKLQPEDLHWLHGAIINCSPASKFGEKHKNIIENYLGSMAALAMFDEGGAEAQIIADLKNKIEDRVKSSPNILHLYRVDGLFIPGSVVLQRTIEELSKCLQKGSMAIKTMNRGAGVTIINTMNEGLVPNRRGYIEDRDPWGTVGSATDKRVKIKIMFLAGLLDIVNSMNKMMSNVTLPA